VNYEVKTIYKHVELSEGTSPVIVCFEVASVMSDVSTSKLFDSSLISTVNRDCALGTFVGSFFGPLTLGPLAVSVLTV
jgi:hypothetical protein